MLWLLLKSDKVTFERALHKSTPNHYLFLTNIKFYTCFKQAPVKMLKSVLPLFSSNKCSILLIMQCHSIKIKHHFIRCQ